MFSSDTTQVSDGGYQISRSLRFNSADSAYLNRTPASATNRKTWTLSLWLKRSELGKQSYLFGATSDSYNANFTLCSIAASDQLYLRDFSASAERFYLQTNAVLRDVSAWYHIVVSVDTTQATSSNRVKLYINNVEQSLGTATYPSQNIDTFVDNTNSHTIGVGSSNTTGGYITETYLIDGQALTPSSFGETNAQTGVWQPKAYSGSYGTNGFYLNFSDNSNTTAATLGKDYSGNGNNWTPNNFSVTAGAGNDSLVDSPTSYGTDTGVGGTVRGNYETLNPLFNATTLSNGNLDASLTSSSVTGTLGPNSDKWYFECTVNSISATAYLGIADQTLVKSDGSFSYSQVYVYLSSGYKGGNGGSASYGASWTTGDVIGIAYDLDAGSITFYKNGVSQGVAFNTGFTSGYFWRPFLYGGTSTNTFTFNFGQRPFAYTAPSGYKALCTQNLPTPTIGATTATQAGKYFNTVLWSGDDTNPRTITGVGFQPDWVWVKGRNAGVNHFLQDAVRGVTSTDTRSLVTNSSDAETNYYAGNGGVTAFVSDGFTTSGGSANANLNLSGRTFVAWNWKANGSGSTNTSGSITSTVSANTTSGFSVVKWNGSGNATIGHGLGIAPSMYIVKLLDQTSQWYVYFKDLGAGKYMQLNLTAAASNDTAIWQNTSPTSTVFYIGSGINANNMIAYCFAEVAGYSKFGSYTGNGSSDGPFVFTGMRPAYIMFKRTNTSGTSWNIFDTSRSPYNVTDDVLFADLSNAEVVNETTAAFDILSNGFKLRTTGSSMNGSGDTYIFMAFASAPFKYSLAR